MTDKKRKLNRQQRLFVHEYLIDFNATAACIRAGYSARNADKIGPELLGKTREWIDEVQRDRETSSELKAEKIEKEIAKIAFMEPHDFVTYYAKGQIVKNSDKMKALELLCRIKGMFNDKLKVSVESTYISIDIVKNGEVVGESILQQQLPSAG